MKLFKATLFAVSLLMAGYSLAHTDEFLDSQASPHGGQVRMTDTHHLELVIKDKEITVYVMNHANEAQPSAGMQATATVLSGDAKTEVRLEPAEENLLKGTGDFKTSDEMKVVLSVTPAPMTARFTPFQKAEAPPASGAAPAPATGHDMSKMEMPAKDEVKK
ncbi:MAG: hypothetical protein BWK73_10960 [Thiothrix lacustris]|uniref:Copper chaperone PCu(A)C n=1 Tax=Thiothrix lacustris TaxID=525917 RepID=A0A1Y1QUX6_9GAMM|nr:MAG: hypothetical protein BWK73_10960 [Thiothrix lacustris]